MRLAVLALLLALPLSSCDVFGGSDEPCPIEGSSPATPISTVTVDYVGQLASSGAVFDEGLCSTFDLQNVIDGFREGIVGMRPAEAQFTFTVPPEKGYGSLDLPGIPANSTLIFTVRLRSVE